MFNLVRVDEVVKFRVLYSLLSLIESDTDLHRAEKSKESSPKQDGTLFKKSGLLFYPTALCTDDNERTHWPVFLFIDAVKTQKTDTNNDEDQSDSHNEDDEFSIKQAYFL